MLMYLKSRVNIIYNVFIFYIINIYLKYVVNSMNHSILFFSNKIQNKYNVYLNYDICEMILDKINYNIFQIELVKGKIKSKLRRYDKLLNIKSPKVFDTFILQKKKMYRKLLIKVDKDRQTKHNILNNINIYDDE